MYKTLLVEELVKEGEALIERLEGRRLQIAAALWHYIEDLDRWRLIVVFSSLVDREGPLRAYTRIQEVLTEMNPKELSLSDISVMGVNDYAFRELRSQVEQSVAVSDRIRSPWRRSQKLSGLADAIIYRWDVQ
jgi:hypothetical protein